MLITGVSGLLGNNLAFSLRDSYEILGLYHSCRVEIDGISTQAVDLTVGDGIGALIKRFSPDIVVHGAAQADVDICEERAQEAERINVFGTRNLVESLNNYPQTKLIYISTDLVYDGLRGDFCEEDRPNPLNCYGITKCKAEAEVLRREGSLVLRTNFFGWNIQDKYSIGEWVIHELTRQREIQGFTDCIFSSIYTFELARILDLAIHKHLAGIYNCASATSMSKYTFLKEIATRLNLNTNLIKPISVDDFGFKARRSKRLNLNTAKLAKALSVDIPSMDHSMKRFVEDFREGIPRVIKSNIVLNNTLPSSDIILYGHQCIESDDLAAVVEVLKSRSITQGPKIEEFESALCQKTEAAFAVAVNSGTSALHIACLAAGIGPGDEVITSPSTFVASANCVVYCGGRPVFADIDPQTYNIAPQEIAKRINERTKAIIPVHFAGQSCAMEQIQGLVRAAEKKYGHKIYIIEDASHALGSRYQKTQVGSCAFSDMAVLSFHPVKHITTGEGGAVLTNDRELHRQLSYFRSHGITSSPEEFIYRQEAFEISPGPQDNVIRKPWYYEQHCLGYNYRITDIQCALGISQLKKLPKFVDRRKAIVRQYNSAFRDTPGVIVPYEADFGESNFHLYVLCFDFQGIGITRAWLMTELKKKGIQTQVHYIPIHTQPFYQKNFATKWGDYPVAEHYYKRCLSIPLHPQLTPGDTEKVISTIRQLIAGSQNLCLQK